MVSRTQGTNLRFYFGFSTRSYENNGGPFAVYNTDCIKEDLVNHIYTEKGERVMMPDFGTRIPLLVFEPNDAETVNVIREDLTTVFTYDPRVDLLALDVFPDPDTGRIVAVAKLSFLEFNVTEDLRIEVTSR